MCVQTWKNTIPVSHLYDILYLNKYNNLDSLVVCHSFIHWGCRSRSNLYGPTQPIPHIPINMVSACKYNLILYYNIRFSYRKIGESASRANKIARNKTLFTHLLYFISLRFSRDIYKRLILFSNKNNVYRIISGYIRGI